MEASTSRVRAVYQAGVLLAPPRAAYECLVHVRALLMMPRAREDGTDEEMRNALFGKRVGQSKLVIRVCARATAARNFST